MNVCAPARVRRLGGLLALGSAALLGVSACGGSSDPSSGGSPSPSGQSSSSASAWPAYDPCDGLDPSPVAQALGSPLKVDTGSSSAARCALLPGKQGGPTYELNYLWWPGGLDAAWQPMNVQAGTVSRPKVPGADAARMVVQQTKKAYYVSGFVQDGSLIQSFNGLALAPYDAGRMRRSALVLLAQLSANAPKDQPSASPTG
ncbi:hypothetical protein [Nocardioides sp. KR10-350]|uniref:hypothetical protein n=1 Tax=Nocardioides cheoyonin TaxID=3156615 RepID=UPI0032B388AD